MLLTKLKTQDIILTRLLKLLYLLIFNTLLKTLYRLAIMLQNHAEGWRSA